MKTLQYFLVIAISAVILIAVADGILDGTLWLLTQIFGRDYAVNIMFGGFIVAFSVMVWAVAYSMANSK